jgi:hypothetical protein
VFFRMLFVFVILSHDRRRIIHIAVTEHPTSEWVARQLREAFPWDNAPRYLLRDRDRSYGERFREAAQWIGNRPIQPVTIGRIVEIPLVGGLHHRYERIVA